ncbi:sugar transporter SWEET1-like isoform X1 [Episyrphus balteatus]|uniref:sugar transporter SWEET1-like isoform X1 n=1 Tax=Episyrphus balteatus TaxID=286459 RepID=UPI00248612ED|nr:sugar transporter SWEET1-like isoform X1 [Episyrphus balteatus]
MLDTLGDFLNPYSDSIGAIAGAATTLHSVSKIVFLNGIRKRGTADGYSAAPFLGSLVIIILNIKLSFILKDTALFRTHVFGIIINIAFISIFYYYTSKQSRPKIWKQFAIAVIFATICIIYTNLEDPAKIESRFGILLSMLYLVLLGAPLLGMKNIIRKKSAENLPFPMILTGTMIVTLWLMYGISIKERVIIGQNILLLLLLSPQLIVCLIYPRTPSITKPLDDKTLKQE